MDQTNCSIGFATDTSFISPVLECNVLLLNFDVVVSVLLLIRFCSLGSSWYEWIRRRKDFTHRTGPRDKKIRDTYAKRIPIVPIVLTITSFLWIIMFTLIRTNVSSFKNGITFFFWVILFDCYSFYSLNQLKKIVNLGNKVIPQSKKFGSELDHSSMLDKFDFTLKVFFILQILSVVIQTALGISGLFFPGDIRLILPTFLVEALYFILNATGLTYQLERLINAVKEAQRNLPSPDKLDAINNIRSQQLWWLLFASPAVCLQFLLFSRVIPLVWEIVLYWILIETSVSSIALINVFAHLCRLRRRKRVDSHSMIPSSKNETNGTT